AVLGEDERDQRGDEQHPKDGDDVGPPQAQRGQGALGDGALRYESGVYRPVYGVPAVPGLPRDFPLTVIRVRPPSLSCTSMEVVASNVRNSLFRSSPVQATWPSVVTVACTGALAMRATRTTGAARGIELWAAPTASASGTARDRDRRPATANTESMSTV